MSGSDDDSIVLDELRVWFIYEADLLARTGLSNMRFFQALDRLIAAGKVEKTDDLYYRLTPEATS